jgi:hypothetical protein
MANIIGNVYDKITVKINFFSMFLIFRKNIDLFEGSKALPACPSDKSNLKIEIIIERLWNATAGRTVPGYFETNVQMVY